MTDPTALEPHYRELRRDLTALLLAQVDPSAAGDRDDGPIRAASQRVRAWLEARVVLEDGRRVSPALLRVLTEDLVSRLAQEDGHDPVQLGEAREALEAAF